MGLERAAGVHEQGVSLVQHLRQHFLGHRTPGRLEGQAARHTRLCKHSQHMDAGHASRAIRDSARRYYLVYQTQRLGPAIKALGAAQPKQARSIVEKVVNAVYAGDAEALSLSKIRLEETVEFVERMNEEVPVPLDELIAAIRHLIEVVGHEPTTF